MGRRQKSIRTLAGTVYEIIFFGSVQPSDLSVGNALLPAAEQSGHGSVASVGRLTIN